MEAYIEKLLSDKKTSLEQTRIRDLVINSDSEDEPPTPPIQKSYIPQAPSIQKSYIPQAPSITKVNSNLSMEDYINSMMNHDDVINSDNNEAKFKLLKEPESVKEPEPIKEPESVKNLNQ